MTTGQMMLRDAVQRLVAAGVPDAPRDARRLLAHALGVDATRLTLALHDPVEPAALARFNTAITRRVAREPVSHIIGKRMFFGREFTVTRDVLDPRPETETLVLAALDAPFSKVLDFGLGSGCILLTLLLECKGAMGVGVDISPAACDVARDNARALGVDASIVQSNWGARITGRFDLIVSNPPYIAADEMPDLSPELRHEPQSALTDGADGLTAYRAILADVPRLITPGGRVLVEIGYAQGPAVAALFRAAGLQNVQILPDLDGRDRVVSGIFPVDS